MAASHSMVSTLVDLGDSGKCLDEGEGSVGVGLGGGA